MKQRSEAYNELMSYNSPHRASCTVGAFLFPHSPQPPLTPPLVVWRKQGVRVGGFMIYLKSTERLSCNACVRAYHLPDGKIAVRQSHWSAPSGWTIYENLTASDFLLQWGEEEWETEDGRPVDLQEWLASSCRTHE